MDQKSQHKYTVARPVIVAGDDSYADAKEAAELALGCCGEVSLSAKLYNLPNLNKMIRELEKAKLVKKTQAEINKHGIREPIVIAQIVRV